MNQQTIILNQTPNYSGTVCRGKGGTLCAEYPVSDYNFYTRLRCYEDAAFGFHSFNIASSCDYTNIGVEEQNGLFAMEIFPNPASDQLYIRTKFTQNNSYTIYSADGRKKTSGKLTGSLQTIDITEFPAGLYCVELSASKQFERQFFVVQK